MRPISTRGNTRDQLPKNEKLLLLYQRIEEILNVRQPQLQTHIIINVCVY